MRSLGVRARRVVPLRARWILVLAMGVAGLVASVWLAQPSKQDQPSPVVFEADAEALKGGILVERSWNEAIVHEVTDDELAAGAAVVYIPGRARPTTVELRFDPISRLSRSDHGRSGH